jgi:hypothetical protein
MTTLNPSASNTEFSAKINVEPGLDELAQASWRDVLPIHPAAELFPRMSADELRVLGKDIKTNGLTSPIVVWSDGKSPTHLLDRAQVTDFKGVARSRERRPLFRETATQETDHAHDDVANLLRSK